MRVLAARFITASKKGSKKDFFPSRPSRHRFTRGDSRPHTASSFVRYSAITAFFVSVMPWAVDVMEYGPTMPSPLRLFFFSPGTLRSSGTTSSEVVADIATDRARESN